VLHAAARGGNEAVMRLLVEDCKAEVEAKDSYGTAALHWAAVSGHEAVVRLLLDDYKADIEAKTDNGMTALHQAAEGPNSPEGKDVYIHIQSTCCLRPPRSVGAYPG
jgi:ankyrin repeat protein